MWSPNFTIYENIMGFLGGLSLHLTLSFLKHQVLVTLDMMVCYLGIYYKEQNDFILNNNFAMTSCIRPPPIQNSTKCK